MRVRVRRPSAALVVSIIALVVALGGTALAGPVAQIAKKISGASIKTHSISGNRLKNDTLTGKQIKESSLKTVPSALAAGAASTAISARTAATALNANALGGVPASGYFAAGDVVRFGGTMTKDQADKTVATIGAVSIVATCNTFNTNGIEAALRVHSTAGGIVGSNSGPWNLSTSDGFFTDATSNDTTSPNDDSSAASLTLGDASAGYQGTAETVVNIPAGGCHYSGVLIKDH